MRPGPKSVGLDWWCRIEPEPAETGRSNRDFTDAHREKGGWMALPTPNWGKIKSDLWACCLVTRAPVTGAVPPVLHQKVALTSHDTRNL